MGSRLVRKQSSELACEVNQCGLAHGQLNIYGGSSVGDKFCWKVRLSCQCCQQCLVRWLATIDASATIWLFRGCNLFKGYRSETASSLSLAQWMRLSIHLHRTKQSSISISLDHNNELLSHSNNRSPPFIPPPLSHAESTTITTSPPPRAAPLTTKNSPSLSFSLSDSLDTAGRSHESISLLFRG